MQDIACRTCRIAVGLGQAVIERSNCSVRLVVMRVLVTGNKTGYLQANRIDARRCGQYCDDERQTEVT